MYDMLRCAAVFMKALSLVNVYDHFGTHSRHCRGPNHDSYDLP